MSATQSITTSVTLTSATTADDIKRWLRNVPDKARLTVSVTPGDRPFDGSEEKITARWSQEVDG